MKKIALNFIVPLYVMSLVLSCKDDDAQHPALPAVAACVIESETITSPGDVSTLEYEFYEGGYLKKISWFDKFHNNTNTYDALGLRVVRTDFDKSHPTSVATNYDADYFVASPVHGNVSVTIDGVTTTNAFVFLFTYDTRGRIEVVTEQTPNTTNDNEWELTVSYDDHDNVSALRYDFTTGPRSEVVVIEVVGYDDKPTPYAAIPGWEYIINHSTWNYSDPTRGIVSLSKNNPLKIRRIANGILKEEMTFEYLYNESGFPTQCTVTNKTEFGQASRMSTFAYQCK